MKEFRKAFLYPVGLILLLVLLVGMPEKIFADGAASVTFYHEHSEAVIHLHHLAKGNQQTGFSHTDKFQNAPVDLTTLDAEDYPDVAGELYSYVLNNSIEPDLVLIQNENNTASTADLEEGLYLVSGPVYQSEDATYITNPSLLQVDAGTVQSVYLKPQLSSAEVQELQAKKVWLNEAGNPQEPPVDRIEAILLKNGQYYAKAEFSKDNNWSYTWMVSDGESGAEWSLQELQIPEGYEASTKTEGLHITLTNQKKREEEPDKPDEPKKPSPKPDPEDPKRQSTPGTGVLTEWKTSAAGTVIALCVGIFLKKKKDGQKPQ